MHSAKRFMMQLAERSPRLDQRDSLELMGSSLSTSQRAELEPHEELLRVHTMRASVLPQRYAGVQAVHILLDRLAASQSELVRLADAMQDALCASPPVEVDLEGGFKFLSE